MLPASAASPNPAQVRPKTLTIGVPCYNEALTIGKVVRDFRKVFPEARVLVIDNASTDDTAQIAREAGADVVNAPRKGKGNAVQTLFREADTDWLIMVDGDDTYPAEEAPKLIATLEERGGDTVVGCRVSDDPAAFKTLHTWANDLLAATIEKVFRSPCDDLFSGYRLFTKRFYRNIPLLSSGFEVETEIALQTIDKGFVQRGVDVCFRSRPEGSFSKLNTVQDGLRVLRVIMWVFKDFRPLLFFATISFCLALLSLLAGAFPIIDYLRDQWVYRVPLAVLAAGLAVISALSLTCGVVLDTIVRYNRQQFFIRMRNYE
jgi:glycosyltransferase involved in cell wall biosynthesis